MKTEQISLRLHPDTLERLNREAQRKHLAKTALIQIALNEYFDRIEKPATATQEDRETYIAA